MGRVTVVLDILSIRRIRQAIRVALLAHDAGLINRAAFNAQETINRLRATLFGPRQRNKRVRFTAQNPLNRGTGVIPRCDGSTGGLDGGNRRGRCTGNNDVDGLLEHTARNLSLAAVRLGRSPGEQLHAIFDAVDAAGFGQFLHGDRAGGINTALVDPVLDSVEVDGGDIQRESILESLENPSSSSDWGILEKHTHSQTPSSHAQPIPASVLP